MRHHAVRMARLVAGSILLVIGVVGGFIPVLQGWIFILLGLSIIAPESERARQLLAWAKTKARAAGVTRPQAPPPPPAGSTGSVKEGRNR